MLERKQISCLIRYKLVKVDETVEENSYSITYLPDLFELKVTLKARSDKVIHLTKQVNK